MNALDWDSLAVNFSATMLHTFWQAAGILLLTTVLLRFISIRYPRTRYNVTLLALALIPLCASFTFASLNHQKQLATRPTTSTQQSGPTTVIETGFSEYVANLNFPEPAPSEPDTTANSSSPSIATRTAPEISWFSQFAPYLSLSWLIGVALMVLRNGRVYYSASQCLKGEPVTDPVILQLLDRLSDQLKIKRFINVIENNELPVPAVWGIWRPVLLIPTSIFSGLPVDYLEPLLAHELAHIRRYDFLINLLQMVLESLLFFNPFVWWLSRQVRREREACCDALAVQTTGEPEQFATALTHYVEHVHESGLYALPALTGKSPNELRDRIERLVIPGYRPTSRIGFGGFVGLVLATLLVLGCMEQGAEVVVAKIMSDEERIEKITTLEVDHQRVMQEQGLPLPVFVNEQKVDPISFRIQGEVSTAEGEGLYATSVTCRVEGEREFKGQTARPSYEIQVEGKRAWLQFYANGYATKIFGPFSAHSKEIQQPLNVVMEKGKTLKGKLTDEKGQAAKGVHISLQPGSRENAVMSYFETCTSNSNGQFTLEHVLPGKYQLLLNGEGYEHFQIQEIVVTKTYLPIQLKVKRSKHVRGQIKTASGEIVSDAKIYMTAINNLNTGRGSSWRDSPSKSRLYAETNKQGEYEINKMKQDQSYSLLIDSETHGFTYVEDIIPDNQELNITIPNSFPVQGRVTGYENRELYSGEQGLLTVKWYPGAGAYSHREWELQLDENGNFKLPLVPAGELGFENNWKKLYPVSAVKNQLLVELDLTDTKRRSVELTFTTADGKPINDSPIQISLRKPGSQNSYGHSRHYKIINGKLRIDSVPIGNILLRDTPMIGYTLNDHFYPIPEG